MTVRREFVCPRCLAVLARVQYGNKPALVVAAGVDPVTDILYRTVTLWCQCGQSTMVTPPRRVQIVTTERRVA